MDFAQFVTHAENLGYAVFGVGAQSQPLSVRNTHEGKRKGAVYALEFDPWGLEVFKGKEDKFGRVSYPEKPTYSYRKEIADQAAVWIVRHLAPASQVVPLELLELLFPGATDGLDQAKARQPKPQRISTGQPPLWF